MWKCDNCQTENFDQIKTCSNCGKMSESNLGNQTIFDRIKLFMKNYSKIKVDKVFVIIVLFIFAGFLYKTTAKWINYDPDKEKSIKHIEKIDKEKRIKLFNESLSEADRNEFMHITLKVVVLTSQYLNDVERKRFHFLQSKNNNMNQAEITEFGRLMLKALSRIEKKGNEEEKKIASRYIELVKKTRKIITRKTGNKF